MTHLVRTRFRISPFWNSLSFGILTLALALTIGYASMYIGTFGDEGDNIAIGKFISQGDMLYRDLFTHHFPFSYYWVAAVFSIAGRSIFTVRLSILIFQLGSFAVAMRLTGLYGPLGLVVVIWSLIRHFFFGNMAIFHVFSGGSLAIIFSLTFALISELAPSRKMTLAAIGLFSAIAILSDPLSVLPVFLTIVVLFFSNQVPIRRSFLVPLVTGSVIVGYFTYVWASGTFSDFWRDVIVFNQEIYGTYYRTDLQGRFLGVFKGVFPNLVSANSILDASAWVNLNSSPWMESWPAIERWLFGGFHFRLAVLLASVVLFLQKKWVPCVYTYIFAASLLLRSEVFFYTIGFVLLSLVCGAWLLFDTWGNLGYNNTPAVSGVKSTSNTQFYSAMLFRGVSAILLVSMLFLAARGALSLIADPYSLSYEANFRNYERLGRAIKSLTCNQEPRLGYYPGDPIVYLFTDLKPVSRYTSMYPWVADLALPGLFAELSPETHIQAIVYIYKEGKIWGRPNREYLADLITYLDDHYVIRESRGQSYYLSPSLIRSCENP